MPILVQPFLGAAGPDLPPVLVGEGGEGEQVGLGLVEESGRLSEALLKLFHHALVWICTASALA